MSRPQLLGVTLALIIAEQRAGVLAYRAELVLAGWVVEIINPDDLVLAHEEGP